MNFTHHDFVFSLSLLSKWNPALSSSFRGAHFSSTLPTRWWMVLLNLLLHYYIILCDFLKSYFLLGQCCHMHDTTSPPAFYPLITFPLSPPLIFVFPPSFPSLQLCQYHGGFLDNKQDQIGGIVKHTMFIVSWISVGSILFFSCAHLPGTSGRCQPFSIEQSDHHSFSADTSHLYKKTIAATKRQNISWKAGHCSSSNSMLLLSCQRTLRHAGERTTDRLIVTHQFTSWALATHTYFITIGKSMLRRTIIIFIVFRIFWAK